MRVEGDRHSLKTRLDSECRADQETRRILKRAKAAAEQTERARAQREAIEAKRR
ncbi:hypothetical protein ACFYWN_44735 [Streptomyces sp. NPDC002917]|uniref:hypothetical protein n=1 Tax=Streptomyces sp. NPDC002917 TaxID=3364671 RepID=UPI0036A0BE1F